MSGPSATPSPDFGNLYQAALLHLARYATTEASLRRLLTRQVERWAQTQPDPDAAAPMIAAAADTIDGIIVRLVEAGALSDAAFAENRAKRLMRGGQSNRAVQARLVAKGVAPDVARAAATADEDTELAAALVLVRRRRIGAYRAGPAADATVRLKELALLARAGFSRDVADRALGLPREEAEQRIFELRR